MAGPYIPLFRPGGDLTCRTQISEMTVTGGRFVQLFGGGAGAGSGYDAGKGVLPTIANCPAGKRALGVAVNDGTANLVDDGSYGHVQVVCGPGTIMEVFCDNNVFAGSEVEVGSNSGAVPLASGKAVGMAMSDGTPGQTMFVRLY